MKKSVPITLSICGGIVSLYIINHLYKKLVINKSLDNNKFMIRQTPMFITYDKVINNKTKMSSETREIFNEFIDVLHNNFSMDNLLIMHSNFSDLKIDDKYIPNKIDNYEGKYSPTKNKVCVSKNYQLPHELFHAASSMVKDGYVYIGFSQCDIKHNKFYGRGINEGYTEIMRRRYFPQYDMEVAIHYNYMSDIMDIIEEIVGKEKCESLY